MPNLSEQDYQKVLIFLQGLYTCQNFENIAAYVRETTPRLVPAELSVFATVDFGNRRVLTIGEAPTVPDMEELFRNCFYEHPFVQYHCKTFDFSACKLSDFWTQEQLHNSELIYHRFMRHLNSEDVLSLSLPNASTLSVRNNHSLQNADIVVDAISLFRGERSFTERDRTILNILQPHLMQARQTAQAFSQLMQEQQDLHDCLNTLGSIVISEEGRIHCLTRKAEYLLKQYFPTFSHLSQTLPERLKQWVTYQRSLLSKHNSTLKPLSPLNIEQSDRLLNVRFAADPDKDQYMLLLSEQKTPSLSIELLKTLGLSTREAEVLFWVIDGKTNAEIADSLHLSINTVRKHLEHIYFKLETHTRAGAVVSAFRRLGVLKLDFSTNC